MPLLQSVRNAEWYLQANMIDHSKDRRSISGTEQKLHGGRVMRDGFQELFRFQGHNLSVRSFSSLIQKEEMNEHAKGKSSSWKKEHFVSWDNKNVLLWQYDKVIKTLRFPASKPNYLCAIIYVQELNLFIAATTDMKFNLYDKNLNLVESIQHEERAILAMEQDHEAGFIVTAGACGLAVWRAYRSLSLATTHVMERMFTFDECPRWVSKVIYNSTTGGKIYAILERSIYVFDINWRTAVAYLKDIHDAPLTRCLWYSRSQFYVTACSGGLIKCYSAIYKRPRGHVGTQAITDVDADGIKLVEPSSLALLHTFTLHTKAVTGLLLHPVSGLMVSCSEDCTVRVINLEALNQLFEVHLASPITDMKLIIRESFKCVLFSQKDGSIRLWEIMSCCSFFALATAEITQLDVCENLQMNTDGAGRSWKNVGDGDHIGKLNAMSSVVMALREKALRTEVALSIDQAQAQEHEKDLERKKADLKQFRRGLVQQMQQSNLECSSIKKSESNDDDDNENNDDGVHESFDTAYVSFSTQDLRIVSSSGKLISRLEPSSIVDGVRSFALSLFQDLLFCLMDCEGTVIKVYNTAKLKCPLLQVKHLRVSDNDHGTCLCLVNVSPTHGSSMAVRRSADAKDFRGRRSPAEIEENLIVGMNTGALLFLDTFSDLEILLIFQAQLGSIDSMVFRASKKDLLTCGYDMRSESTFVKVWKLKELKNSHMFTGAHAVSCWSASPSLNYLAFGSLDGIFKLYSFLEDNPDNTLGFSEVTLTGQHHDAAITAVSFCEESRVIVTCAADFSAMLWDYQNRYLKTIIFNNPLRALQVINKEADFIISQRSYLLVVPRSSWDDGVVDAVKAQVDVWTEESRSATFSEDDVRILLDNCTASRTKKHPEKNKGITFLTGTNCQLESNLQTMLPRMFKSAAVAPSLEVSDEQTGNRRSVQFSLTDYIRRRVQEDFRGNRVVFDTRRPRLPGGKNPFLASSPDHDVADIPFFETVLGAAAEKDYPSARFDDVQQILAQRFPDRPLLQPKKETGFISRRYATIARPIEGLRSSAQTFLKHRNISDPLHIVISHEQTHADERDELGELSSYYST